MNQQNELIDTRSALEVKVTITRIVWEGKGNVIARANVMPGQDELPSPTRYPVRELSVIGAMHKPVLGGCYTLVGERIDWNAQYKTCELRFYTYTTELPNSNFAAIEYLMQVASGVGSSLAEKIIKRFGPEGIQILKTDPDRAATETKGLSPDVARRAAEDLKQNEAIEHATIEVHGILAGVLPRSVSRKAVKRWGSDAAHIIKEDPFALTVLRGVGFQSADVIHTRLKRPADAMSRHVAAVIHVLGDTAAREGSTIAPVDMLQLKAAGLVQQLRPDAINEATANRELTVLYGDNGTRQQIQLREIADHEVEIAGRIITMMNEPLARTVEPRNFDELADEQRTAAQQAITNPVFILTGAPGTGKTYTTARIATSLRAAGLSLMMCAPTGKAAKQLTLALSSTCGGQADTIHSTLGACYDEEEDTFGFQHGPEEPLDTDVLLVDEASMIPVALGDSLFSALLPTTRVIVIGDHYQLPSVGPGAVLRDMLAAGVPSFELRQIRRNAGDIVRACHDIKDGRIPDYPTDAIDLKAGHNWRHIPAKAYQIPFIIEQLLSKKLPERGLDALWDVQIISPTNDRGAQSCKALNAVAKGVLNPSQDANGLQISIRDKVVRLKNGQATGVSLDDKERVTSHSDTIRIVNGDIGVVEAIDDKHIIVKFLYPTRRVQLPRREHHLRRAFCMTCHKMQGSEVPVVIMPLTRSVAAPPMVTREWIYTAFSRAKLMLITIGNKDVLPQIIARIGMNNRRTTLQERIQSALAAPARTINARS